jgi:thiol-disulfide isomerase/thioredoxin
MILSVTLAAVSLAATAGRAVAADAVAPQLDAKADAIVRAFCTHVQALPRFTCELTLTMKTASEGMKQEIETTYGFAMEKPNKMALRHKRGMAGNTVVSDGTNLFTCLGMVNRYEEKKAPATLEELFQSAPMAGNMLFLDNLLRKDVYGAIMEGVTQMSLAGRETVDGRECDRLSFKQDDFDWEMWITTGDQPTVVQVRTDMSKSMAAMRSDMPGMKSAKMTVENHFANWVTGAELPKDAFAFTPPEGAKKVDSLFENMDEEEPEAGREADGPATLIGKKAPAFDLSTLDESRAVVPDPKLTNAIVVLDFWATWCGPCRKALPAVVRATDAFKDKGVVFFAVNEQEQPERIREFLKKNEVTCRVALDEEGQVGNLYKVRGIPQTVIIGRDGTVQAVHVGLDPDLEARLSKELAALVEGKPLPSKAE